MIGKAAGRYLGWIAVGLLLTAMAACSTAIPTEYKTTQVVPANVVPATPTAVPTALSLPTPLPEINEFRRLTMEWPETIRVGDSDEIRLTLEVDDMGNVTPTAEVAGHVVAGDVVEIPNLYDSHNVMAEARLDMAGMPISPAAEVSQPMLPGRAVTFYWSISPDALGSYQGRLWLFLRFIPKDGGVETVSPPLISKPIEVEAVNFLGVGGRTARLMGGFGTLLGSVISLDSILPWLWKRFRAKKAFQRLEH